MNCSYCDFAIKKNGRMCACKSAHYCDRDCQQDHWPAHKLECTYRRVPIQPLVLENIILQPQMEANVETEIDASAAKRLKSLANEARKGYTAPTPAAANHVPPKSSRLGKLKGKKRKKTTPDNLNNAGRDLNTGKFAPKSGKQTDKQRKNAVHAANFRDFKVAKERLQSIKDRNLAVGENWEFKIESQKRTKGAKHGSHCWKTDNFSSMQRETEVPASSDDEEGEDAEVSYPIKRSKRVCTNCKHSIKGPQWSYLVCKGKDCTNGMTHFECIGFPDVPLELNHLMKNEYECPGCYAKRVVALDEEADFQHATTQKKTKKRKLNPRMSQMLAENRTKNTTADAQDVNKEVVVLAVAASLVAEAVPLVAGALSPVDGAASPLAIASCSRPTGPHGTGQPNAGLPVASCSRPTGPHGTGQPKAGLPVASCSRPSGSAIPIGPSGAGQPRKPKFGISGASSTRGAK